MSTSALFLLLSVPVIGVGLHRYRADYQRLGHSTSLGVGSLLAAWLMPHLVLGYAFPMFPAPHTIRQWAGYALMALSLVASVLVLWGRFSPRMIVGHDTRTLVTEGPYRWSRNPQYVAYAPFLAGYALTGDTLMGWMAVALFLVLVHLTVLVEEEHLERQFGDRYRAYRAATPRYLPR